MGTTHVWLSKSYYFPFPRADLKESHEQFAVLANRTPAANQTFQTYLLTKIQQSHT